LHERGRREKKKVKPVPGVRYVEPLADAKKGEERHDVRDYAHVKQGGENKWGPKRKQHGLSVGAESGYKKEGKRKKGRWTVVINS